MTVSDSALTDSVYYPDSGVLLAEAAARPLFVSALSDGNSLFGQQSIPLHHSTAGAKTELWFSPATSGLATVELDFLGYSQWYWSLGFVRLVDVTSSETVWNSWFGVTEPGTVPWEFVDSELRLHGKPLRAAAVVPLNADFDESHTYQLTMFTQTFADWDDQLVTITLNGLNVVPEPTTFTLLGLGALALVMARRR